MSRVFRRAFLRVSTLLLLSASAQAFSLDLHSHFFMKDGLGVLLRGDFDEPTGAEDAGSRFRTKLTRASLDPSGLKLVVVSIYAHPVMTLGKVKESLLRQIERLEAFVSANPGWVIAAEPAEARAALAAGKRVFVLSLETAAAAVESAEDQELFVERKKIRIVTFLHLSPDRLGRGVSLWTGFGLFNSPLELMEAWFTKTTDPATGAYVNPYGLSSFGRSVLEALAKRRVWIDLAHASDRAVHEMTGILDRYGQPALYTHTKLREFFPAEQAIPRIALERVKATRGIAGLIPTDAMTPDDRKSLGLPPGCKKGIRAFAEEWKTAAGFAGAPEAIALGSDFNAPIEGLAPGCLEKAASADAEMGARGFYRAEDLPRLQTVMRALGVDPEPSADRALERFLAAWEKVRPATASKGIPDKAKQSPSG